MGLFKDIFNRKTFAFIAKRKLGITEADRLFKAIEKGDIDAATVLVDKNPALVHVKFSDVAPDTPLSFAGIYGRAAIAEMLIERGAVVDAPCSFGQTPLFSAVNSWIGLAGTLHPNPLFILDPSNHQATIALLAKHGANINTVNDVDNTPIDRCLLGFTQVAEALIDLGADIERKNKRGMTLLMNAAHAKSEKMVALLLRRGANVAETDHTGKNALDHARLSDSFTHNHKHTDVIKLLEDALNKHYGRLSAEEEIAKAARDAISAANVDNLSRNGLPEKVTLQKPIKLKRKP